ncbi:gamma-glutamyltransferase [Streptomyces fragilis]|uniref:Gamma-glutamyltransferase n=1 Tax=Streptomyces fragilis TaxID=67301 RepID=A0ABV2YKZ8_9ACTN|nr:gamma-glutamyltransferase [Streptomyces fragilis]
MPAKNTKDQKPLRYVDAIDIPVLFRDVPGGRTRSEWRRNDHAAWTGTSFPSSNGWYLPTTTWRNILQAAVGVGRDISPWLNRPHYAMREMGARIAPLNAYLDLHEADRLHGYNAGRRLTANVVLEQGTEASAVGAFSYRLGMTMAEWACRSLMGLGETWHIENSWPLGIRDPAAGTKPAKGKKHPRPDLWGQHHAEGRHWLIEAKGGDIKSAQLDRGWEQLLGGCTVLHPHGVDHRVVLCGAALKRGVGPKNDLFVIIRHEHHPGAQGGSLTSASGDGTAPTEGQSAEELLDEDDTGELLLDVARSQILTYLALRALEASAFSRLRLVPVARDRGGRRPTAGPLTLMEDDETTRERRAALHSREAAPNDASARTTGLESFLTGRIPHTEVTLGMSRRLYATCAALFRADREIADRTPGLRAEDRATAVEEEELEERSAAARREYRERQEDVRPILQRQLREVFVASHDQPWEHRLTGIPRLTVAPAALEATTPETYLAVDASDLFPY